jgi:quercetin dioxygenase-like cupin family protein
MVYLEMWACCSGALQIMNSVTKRVPVVTLSEDVPAKFCFGGTAKLFATAESTAGAFSMIEQTGEPGVGSPYHLHHADDEAMYVLEGTLRFVSEGQSWEAGPGSWAYLPKEVPHGFEVVGNTTARFLLLTTPAGFDGFVQELSEDEPSIPDYPAMIDTAKRYGMDILGPLPQ